MQTTAHNPTANAICEQSHLTIQNLLRALTHHNLPKTIDNAKNLVDQAIATTSHALRVNISKKLGHNSSGSLAFNQDMLLDLPFIADWEVLRWGRQLRINERLRRTNRNTQVIWLLTRTKRPRQEVWNSSKARRKMDRTLCHCQGSC